MPLVRPRTRRAGFTLIELLIVVAIIAVLVSLTTAGVFKAFDLMRDVQNRADMTKLAQALAAFEGKHKVYPPSRIKLSNSLSELDDESKRYLSRIWPKLDWAGGKIDWTGGQGYGINPDKSKKTFVILEGDQCLVFFLGGIPGPSGPLGFSPSPKNPTSLGANHPEKFYDFEPTRLYRRTDDEPFLSYLDGYSAPEEPDRKPFIYFSSRFAKNGYSGTEATLTVSPYYRMNGARREYYNPNTFQLISAGPDNMFGSGGLFDPANVSLEGEDDQINFGSGEAGNAE